MPFFTFWFVPDASHFPFQLSSFRIFPTSESFRYLFAGLLPLLSLSLSLSLTLRIMKMLFLDERKRNEKKKCLLPIVVCESAGGRNQAPSKNGECCDFTQAHSNLLQNSTFCENSIWTNRPYSNFTAKTTCGWFVCWLLLLLLRAIFVDCAVFVLCLSGGLEMHSSPFFECLTLMFESTSVFGH